MYELDERFIKAGLIARISLSRVCLGKSALTESRAQFIFFYPFLNIHQLPLQ